MYSHTGTHIDAPAHMLAGAPALDQLGVDRFVGRACAIDVSALAEARGGGPALEAHARLVSGCEFVLLHFLPAPRLRERRRLAGSGGGDARLSVRPPGRSEGRRPRRSSDLIAPAPETCDILAGEMVTLPFSGGSARKRK
jgi:hypothetical protein